MFLISHRGNLDGPNPREENNPSTISKCLKLGYHVEVDVWYINNKFYLGHDKPEYSIGEKFLTNEKLWCHAKNINSLEKLLEIGAHCFWHQKDKVTLTSKGFIWTFPGQELTKRSICVLPELYESLYKNNLANCSGLCSDYVVQYKV